MIVAGPAARTPESYHFNWRWAGIFNTLYKEI